MNSSASCFAWRVVKDDAIHFLSTIGLFGGLSEEALKMVVASLGEQSYPTGSVVCRQDEPSHAMYIIRSGQVVLRRHNESGRSVKVLRLGPGEFFGEATLIELDANFASAIVDSPSVLYRLTGQDLYQLYQKDVHNYALLLNNLCRELSRRLRKAEHVICERADQLRDERTQMMTIKPGSLPRSGAK